MDALYAHLFEITGKPRRVLDLACGLNPIYLAARGINVLGLDAHLGAVALVNRFAEENALDARAEGADLRTAELPEERFDLALVFKLLPLLGLDGYDLLGRVRAGFVAVSFPTRTLSGRSVGMERNYSSAFEENCPQRFAIAETRDLVYLRLKGALIWPVCSWWRPPSGISMTSRRACARRLPAPTSSPLRIRA